MRGQLLDLTYSPFTSCHPDRRIVAGNNTDRPATIRERNKKVKQNKNRNFKMGGKEEKKRKKFALDSLRIRIRKALRRCCRPHQNDLACFPPPPTRLRNNVGSPDPTRDQKKNEKRKIRPPRKGGVVTSSKVR